MKTLLQDLNQYIEYYNLTHLTDWESLNLLYFVVKEGAQIQNREGYRVVHLQKNQNSNILIIEKKKENLNHKCKRITSDLIATYLKKVELCHCILNQQVH